MDDCFLSNRVSLLWVFDILFFAGVAERYLMQCNAMVDVWETNTAFLSIGTAVDRTTSE